MGHSGIRIAAAALTLAFCQSSATAVFAEDSAESRLVAQAEATDITAAIAAYRQAQSDLEAVQASDGDVEGAQAKLDAAKGEVARLCGVLGQDDVEACVAAIESGTSGEPAVAADQPPTESPPAEDVQSPAPAEAPTPPQPLLDAVANYEASNSAYAEATVQGGETGELKDSVANALKAVEEQCAQIGQPDTAACLAQFGIELTPVAEPVAVEPQPTEPQAESAAQPEADQEADQTETPQPEAKPEPAEPAVAEPAENLDDSGADEPAAVADDTMDTAPEAPATQEGDAKGEVVVNPKGTPLPRELSQAIATYEDANRQLANSTASTPEAEAARKALEAARNDISALCEQDGASDIESCLSAYGVGLTPEAEPMSADAKPAEPAVPEAEQAPLLDSAKDAQKLETSTEPAPSEPVEPATAEAPPQSDADAQADVAPEDIPSIETEQGTEAKSAISVDTSGPKMQEQPANAEVVDQSGPRIVFKFNNQLFISNQSDNRLSYGADERYVEQLPRNRTRETIVRANGTRLVTIYDRYGDVLRRSHFDQNGNEAILAYTPETYDDTVSDWVDPAESLPPLNLNIPPEDYVLDAQRADLDALTLFLDAPPVEKVKRLYSIDEVKRSARVRDMVRRLEIGNLTFDFGSAGIPPDQLGALSIVANAMLRLIDENPAETFLIEGHTDAVGSDYANLILSDERAYSVAIALTEVFGVPPENIATQGYGERYLKVLTDAPERVNRRVTIRRITPLVAPASSGYIAG